MHAFASHPQTLKTSTNAASVMTVDDAELSDVNFNGYINEIGGTVPRFEPHSGTRLCKSKHIHDPS